MRKSLFFKFFCSFLLLLCLIGAIAHFRSSSSFSVKEEEPLYAPVQKKSFSVEVRAIGELEAARSIGIASTLKGDQVKLISLIADGQNVKPGDTLIKIDPSPFEEKIDDLKAKKQEQETAIRSLEQALAWEKTQAEHEKKIASLEAESAELEWNKLSQGEGPLEINRLQIAMQKARGKYEELKNFLNDLSDLESQGLLNSFEIKQAEKKLAEEKEIYEAARQQWSIYTEHVYPMQLKKSEAQVKRAKIKQEEAEKTCAFKIAKAELALLKARQAQESLLSQLKEAEKLLEETTIRAPSPGMVVHREDFRGNQKRKPRIGDILLRNQPLIDLPDLDSLQVKTKVRELDLFKVRPGSAATIEIDAYPHLIFSGKVLSIGVLALADFTRTSEEKYFEARLALNEMSPLLRPGMTARATIHVDRIEEKLAIPLQALFETDKKTYCYVKKERKSAPEKRLVEVGICNEHWAEIKKGLKEGEEVALYAPSL